MRDRVSRTARLAISAGRPAVLAAGLLQAALAGCSAPTATGSSLQSPPPYRLFAVDRGLSCAAIAASFHDAAVRAARIQSWLAAGPLPGYGLGRFEADAPAQLADERGRLDALADLQRFKGCPVQDPVAAVAAERGRLPPPRPAVLPPAVLRRLG